MDDELHQAFPDANALLDAQPAQLGAQLLFVFQKRKPPADLLHLNNFFSEIWPESYIPGQETIYPQEKREAIKEAFGEAWAWLETSGLLVSPGGTNGANGFRKLSRQGRSFKALGDLAQSVGPIVMPSNLGMIAEIRLASLRKLTSTFFDFAKLIKLCEELNSSYATGNYCATAMLTRALLDHVPPLFQKGTFKEVVNQYGGSSFKATMLHLENGARKIADMILHSPIQKTESLPTQQQVHFAPQLDVLLAEIIRIKP